jgi:large subunit ribosomal protein L15
MKLHDLQPADGSRKPRTRVGRGIAAGGGKTAGRGTKGQKARAGGSIPPWFEGGQTPLHMRIPKLRGFKNRFKVDYEVVNIGAIAALAETGTFEPGEPAGAKPKSRPAPITINQEILRATGLVRTLDKPMKILGGGELSTPLFVVADAFSRTAVAKIEAAGGSVNVLEIPGRPMPALTGTPVEAEPAAPELPAPSEPAPSEPAPSAAPARRARAARAAPVDEPAAEAAVVPAPEADTSVAEASTAEPEGSVAEPPAPESAPADDSAG